MNQTRPERGPIVALVPKPSARQDAANTAKTRTPVARPNSSITIECERCGNEQIVERSGRFRDDDYYELWHESQGRIHALEKALEDSEWRVAYLEQYRDALAVMVRRSAIEIELQEEAF